MEDLGLYGRRKEDNIIDAKTIAANLSRYHGKYINYNTPNGCKVKWLILTSDAKNIYIIADDYVSKDYVPSGRKGSRIYVNDTDYKLSFEDVIKDYDGSIDIDEKLHLLSSKYFEVIKDSDLSSDNAKVMAYMMDVNAWSGFASMCAEFSIGGPTLELLINSHNELYPQKVIEYCSGRWGYMVRKKGIQQWTNFLLNAFDDCDRVYIIKDCKKACRMWLASASGYDSTSMCTVFNLLYSDSCMSSACGFRPLVCLKSNVRLEEKSDGSFSIK